VLSERSVRSLFASRIPRGIAGLAACSSALIAAADDAYA
jgi:hypothetical protein